MSSTAGYSHTVRLNESHLCQDMVPIHRIVRRKIFNLNIGVYLWQNRVCWTLHCLCRPLCIFERCQDSNPESCHSKQARYLLSHPSLSKSVFNTKFYFFITVLFYPLECRKTLDQLPCLQPWLSPLLLGQLA
jgi:hypothetical protein